MSKKLKIRVSIINRNNYAKKIQACFRGYSFRIKPVLEECSVYELMNQSQLDELIERLRTEYLTPFRMEYYNSTSTKNLNLEDGFMEYITSKCINGDRVGQGNCPIDIKKDNIGIDVGCLCLNRTRTNEKSIMQKLGKTFVNHLNELWRDGNYKDAFFITKKLYVKKMVDAKKNENIKKFYYLIFISNSKHIYLYALKLNLEHILNLKYKNILPSNQSIDFKYFIDEKIGRTNLCKPKNRLELRFKKSIFESPYLTKIIELE
jgi:hypothetical protein